MTGWWSRERCVLDNLEASATIARLLKGRQMDFITCQLRRIDDGLCEEPRPCPGSASSTVSN